MKLLLKVFTFLGIIFRKLKGINEDYVFPAIDIVTHIREALLSKEVDWFVNITNSDWDNKLRDKLIKKLAQSIVYMKISAECIKLKDPVEIINCFIEQLKGQPKYIQDAVLFKLSAVMVKKSFANGKVKQSEADLLVQMAYTTNKEYKRRNPLVEETTEEKS